VLTAPRECYTLVRLPAARTRCAACIRSGGQFVLDGPGKCVRPEPTTRRPLPPPPPPVAAITDANECQARVAPVLPRRRCISCVHTGGAFDVRSAQCTREAPARRPPPPPPPTAPTLSVRLENPRAARGSDVRLIVEPPQPSVEVFFNGRLMPKRVLAGGRILVVTVPANAADGFFEVAWAGRRFRAPQMLVVGR
jgi:hypothetical protein